MDDHFLFVSISTNEVLGCCTGDKGEGQVAAIFEDVSFVRLVRERCPFCQERGVFVPRKFWVFCWVDEDAAGGINDYNGAYLTLADARMNAEARYVGYYNRIDITTVGPDGEPLGVLMWMGGKWADERQAWREVWADDPAKLAWLGSLDDYMPRVMQPQAAGPAAVDPPSAAPALVPETVRRRVVPPSLLED